MPEHLHLLIPRSRDAVWKLGGVLRGISRHLSVRSTWENIPPPRDVADQQHLQRTTRYILLNPCRRKIVNDPLLWEFSTHRDLLRMLAQPWVTADHLRRNLGWATNQFRKKFHDYVCREDTVGPQACILPPASRPDIQIGSLSELTRAYSIYHRIPIEECHQRGTARSILLPFALEYSGASGLAIAEEYQISDRILSRYRQGPGTPQFENLRGVMGAFFGDRRLFGPTHT